MDLDLISVGSVVLWQLVLRRAGPASVPPFSARGRRLTGNISTMERAAAVLRGGLSLLAGTKGGGVSHWAFPKSHSGGLAVSYPFVFVDG